MGGRFGWAVHRFPIKGGKTMRETVLRESAERLHAASWRPSYFYLLFSDKD